MRSHRAVCEMQCESSERVYTHITQAGTETDCVILIHEAAAAQRCFIAVDKVMPATVNRLTAKAANQALL